MVFDSTKEWRITIRKPFYNPFNGFKEYPDRNGEYQYLDNKNYDEQRHTYFVISTMAELVLQMINQYGVLVKKVNHEESGRSWYRTEDFIDGDNKKTYITFSPGGEAEVPIEFPKEPLFYRGFNRGI